MELRVCPNCKKVFYIANAWGHIICPHCKYSIYERREQERISESLRFTFTIKGSRRPATLADYSRHGARMVYRGSALRVNTIVDIDVNRLHIHRKGKVVWTKKINSSRSVSGLMLL